MCSCYIRVVEEPHIFRALLSAGEGDNTTAEALFRVQLTEVPAPVVGRDAQNGTDQVPGVGTRRRGAVAVGARGVEGGVDVQLVEGSVEVQLAEGGVEVKLVEGGVEVQLVSRAASRCAQQYMRRGRAGQGGERVGAS